MALEHLLYHVGLLAQTPPRGLVGMLADGMPVREAEEVREDELVVFGRGFDQKDVGVGVDVLVAGGPTRPPTTRRPAS